MKKISLTQDQHIDGAFHKKGTELEVKEDFANFLIEKKLAAEVVSEKPAAKQAAK